MILYDLTNTPAATSEQPIQPPEDHELLAITVALLSVEDRGFDDLLNCAVALTDRNCRRIAELIEERTPSLARDFGNPGRLRARLRQLVGLRISR